MDLEKHKAAWQKHQFEEPPRKELYRRTAAKLRNAAKARRWKNLLRDEKELCAGLLVALLCLAGLPFAAAWYVKAGLVVALIAIGLGFMFYVVHGLALRPDPLMLPTSVFLARERKWMKTRFTIFKWLWWFPFLFPVGSIYHYRLSVTGRLVDALLLVGWYVLLVAIVQITMIRRLSRRYIQGLKTLDRILHELRGEISPTEKN